MCLGNACFSLTESPERREASDFNELAPSLSQAGYREDADRPLKSSWLSALAVEVPTRPTSS